MATKLGAHVLRSATDLGEFIDARPAVVKFVGDWGMARSVPAGTLVMGAKALRYDAQSQKKGGESPADAARRFVDDLVATYQANPLIEYWEGHNEPVWSTEEEMGWYARFEIERMKLMSDLGLKCVIGNFSTGTPPLRLWPAFMPALEAALEHKAILGLHEYSCPWMWWMTGEHQLDEDEDQGDEGWTTLRYRKAYRQYLMPNGVGDVPLAITECGVDPLVNPKPPGAPSGTWKQLGDFWAEHDNERDKADFYFRQLVWYDEELQEDDYVVGATIFTWGNFGTPWSHFDVAGTDVAKKLVRYVSQNPAEPFEYPEIGTGNGDEEEDEGDEDEMGQEVRGLPRIQYERTYVLLPPGSSAAWAQAAVEATWDETRYTIGGSADDAGIGDLDERRVIAINPHNWPGALTLEEFFQQYYPEVEYVSVVAATPEELVDKLSDL